MGDSTFFCDCCGRKRVESPNVCSYCGLNVCNKCWRSQAAMGHEMAEHRHEMARASGCYTRGDEDYETQF